MSNDRPVVVLARLCPVCNDGPVRRWGEKSACELWRCLRCQAILCAKSPDRTEIDRLYEHYHDAARFSLAPTVEASLQRLVSLGERSRLTGRWLDVGYGEGGLLEAAQRRGWSCYGVEVSPSMLEYGSSKGW
jgi:SAM-dependent methyltransferase